MTQQIHPPQPAPVYPPQSGYPQPAGYPQPPAGPPVPPPPYAFAPPPAPPARTKRTGLIVGIVVGALVVAGLAVGAVFLFGTRSLDTAEAQTKIAELTRQQIGITPTGVSCPTGIAMTAGTTFTCTATLDGQPISYTVKETDDSGHVRVDSDNNLILVRKVEQSVAQQVGDEAGVTATATCDTAGRTVLVDKANTPIPCTVVNSDDPTDTLDVTATVDETGSVSWTS
jgi:hypothetical protein